MFFQPPVSEEFEKIMAANLEVIEEFGEPLCSLICRDACEGQEVGRVRESQIKKKQKKGYILVQG